MNLASALIKQVLVLQDFETWASVREHYLPSEYQTLFKIIDKHCSTYHELPTLEDLKFEIRDVGTKEKLYAIESVEVEAEPHMLLQYLKNEYTQKEVLNLLENYVENSVAFEDAEESLAHLHQIIMDIEALVDLEEPQESMQRIDLFDSDETYGKYLALGLNADFDLSHQFAPPDLILLGGYRGQGKSVVCGNIAVNMYEKGRSSITYSTEMPKRPVLQRMCAMATGIDYGRLKFKNLSTTEWDKVATWWAERFQDSSKAMEEFLDHRDFDKLHKKLTSEFELRPECQIDIVYDPQLTIPKIRADLDKKMKGGMDIAIIIVDYLNKVKLNATPSKRGAFDWIEQLEVSTALKAIAAEFERPVFAPFQINEDGSARFSKGIHIDADAVYNLKAHKGENPCIKFTCEKMRDGDEQDFTSIMDWNSLRLGPETGIHPDDVEEDDEKTGEEINDPF